MIFSIYRFSGDVKLEPAGKYQNYRDRFAEMSYFSSKRNDGRYGIGLASVVQLG